MVGGHWESTPAIAVGGRLGNPNAGIRGEEIECLFLLQSWAVKVMVVTVEFHDKTFWC